MRGSQQFGAARNIARCGRYLTRGDVRDMMLKHLLKEIQEARNEEGYAQCSHRVRVRGMLRLGKGRASLRGSTAAVKMVVLL